MNKLRNTKVWTNQKHGVQKTWTANTEDIILQGDRIVVALKASTEYKRNLYARESYTVIREVSNMSLKQ
jgi:hypothetical protein